MNYNCAFLIYYCSNTITSLKQMQNSNPIQSLL